MSTNVVALMLAVAMTGQTAPRSAADPVDEDCKVLVMEEAQVPGRQPGALVELKVREGMEVKAGDVLGRIDDAEAQAQKLVKEIEYKAAVEKSKDDIEIRFAKKSAAVAHADLEASSLANKHTAKAITEVEMRRLRLLYEKALLQIEKSTLDLAIAVLTTDAKKAEAGLAATGVEQRLIKSPIDGIVVQVYRQLGEWVPPGDTVMRVVRMNRLRVEGFVSAEQFDRHQLEDRDVTVEVQLAGNRRLKVPGKVTFVSPLIEVDEYRVWAEIENPRANGRYVLSPGSRASMTIHINGTGREPQAAQVTR